MKNLKSYISIRKKLSKIFADNNSFSEAFNDAYEKLGPDADFNHIDVTNVTEFKFLNEFKYRSLSSFPSDFKGDISEWNTSSVENLDYLFKDCTEFNCDLSHWDTSNVTSMNATFINAWKFNQDISIWDYSNVDNMFAFMYGAESYYHNMYNANIKNNIYCVGAFSNTKLPENYLPKVITDNRIGKLDKGSQTIIDILGDDIVEKCHSIRQNRGGSLEIIINDSLKSTGIAVKFIIYFETPNQVRLIRKQTYSPVGLGLASKLLERDYLISLDEAANWLKQYINKRLSK